MHAALDGEDVEEVSRQSAWPGTMLGLGPRVRAQPLGLLRHAIGQLHRAALALPARFITPMAPISTMAQ